MPKAAPHSTPHSTTPGSTSGNTPGSTGDYVQVAIPSPLRRLFDYLPPKGLMSADCPPGCRVKVPFGRRNVVGVVVGHRSETDVPQARLRPIGTLLDDSPVIPADILALARWAANYYHYSLGEVLASLMPTLMRQGEPPTTKGPLRYSLTEIGKQNIDSIPANAVRQKALLTHIRNAPEPVGKESFADMEGEWHSALRRLIDKGWITSHELPCLPAPNPSPLTPPNTNPEQQAAIDAVASALDQSGVFLLEGVTGSGKTEVYLRLIQACLDRNQQALVLVPEIGLTPQLVQRFRDRLDVPIAVLHSALNENERLCGWMSAAQGRARVVIGTRSAAFVPLPDPGLFLIDEEHDTSFKQQDGFRYSARDLVIMRAHRCQRPVLLGSATPSLESIHNATEGRFHLLRLTQRAGDATPPHVSVTDIRNTQLRGGLSPPLIDAMKQELQRGKQILLFLNRRGFAPVLSCHECGWVADCQRCDAHLVVHEKHKLLSCHHCGHEQRLPERCPECASGRLIRVGQGTERLETELQSLFPNETPLRIDRDSTRRKGSLDAALRKVNDGEARILIGTQMLAKGHHFPQVSLVAILDADGGLFGADFRASERMAQLIVQVAGRAGREKERGKVIIQSRHPDHPLLQTLVKQGYQALSRILLEERKLTGLPPYCSIALLRAEAHQREDAEQFLEQVRDNCENWLKETKHQGVQLFGPAPASMERRAGRYRLQLLLQAQQRPQLHALLTPLLPWLESHPQGRKVRWSLDVDPTDVA